MDVEGKRAREGWSGRWCEGRKKEERQENRGGEFRQGRQEIDPAPKTPPRQPRNVTR